jgi:hypothetical protein
MAKIQLRIRERGSSYKKNKETKEIQTVLQAPKKNESHFWTYFGTHMRASQSGARKNNTKF